MVKEYTLLLGGYLGITSQPGKGTSISVCCPYNPEELTDTSYVEQNEYENELLNQQTENSPVYDTPAGSATILLVEDDAEMRSYLMNLLKKHYRVITAGNGQQGFEKALISRPDVILTDLIMPLADGLEMNRMLKENPVTMHIPLIILTGQTEPGMEIDSLRAGADVFLTKPFHDELLITHIQNQLARRKSYSITENDMIDKKVPDEAMSPDQYTLNKAVKIIESNLQNPSFEVDILASELNMSRTTLYRKMKTLTGQSATEFIRNTRLKKAIEMIEKEKLSIEEVGIAVGFNSHSYFSHCFRQYFGKTPTEYLTELKKRKKE